MTQQEKFLKVRHFIRNMEVKVGSLYNYPSKAALIRIQKSCLKHLDWFYSLNNFELAHGEAELVQLLTMIQLISKEINQYELNSIE